MTPPRPASAEPAMNTLDEEAADAVAERLDHLGILDARPDQQADAGAVEQQLHADEDHEADDDRDDAVALHDDVAEHEGAAQGLRQRDRDRRGAPDRVDRLLGDDQAAHGDEDLLQVAAIDRAAR